MEVGNNAVSTVRQDGGQTSPEHSPSIPPRRYPTLSPLNFSGPSLRSVGRDSRETTSAGAPAATQKHQGVLDTLAFLYSEKSWREKTGILAHSVRTFFKIFPEEKATWALSGALSFPARIGAAMVVPHFTDSKVIFPVAVYSVGAMINWATMYCLFRLEDRRECRASDGALDVSSYMSSERRLTRFLFFPKQEVGSIFLNGICSAAVMTLSKVWEGLYGPLGSIVTSTGAALLQWCTLRHYMPLYGKVSKWINVCRSK